jgi:redox-sensitive bicupin YhaK (pirin superfamily)
MQHIVRRNAERIHKTDAWKKSAYAFVPYQTHFGELCGFADDWVNASQGFGMHPHQNMEITTILMQGKQVHKDNTGSQGVIDELTIQTMSAGTGIMHSEFNASVSEAFHSYQIWVYPKTQNVAPRYGSFKFTPQDKLNTVLLALSPDGRKESALINQDAFFSVLTLQAGQTISYNINMQGNGVYIHTAAGSIVIADNTLAEGDAMGCYDTEEVSITAVQTSELVFVEVPMQRGIKLN